MRQSVANVSVAALLATSTVALGQPGRADTILVGARVVTADESRPFADAVALGGDRILAVGSIEDVRRVAGLQTRIRDVSGATIIPGLIDAHVHLMIAPQITDEASLRTYEQTTLPTILRGFVMHGVTTVRSTGDPLPYIVELRDRIHHAAAGPRLVVTGPTATSPGGHPATTGCRNNPFCRQGLARELFDSDGAREAVRELSRATVDAVKLTIDDRVPGVAPLPDPVVSALVDEAHRQKLRVITHLTVGADAATARRLVELGVDEFVHLPFHPARDPVPAQVSAIATLLSDRKIPVTMTLSMLDAYTDPSGTLRAAAGDGFIPFPPERLERWLRIVPVLADAGVRLVVGTDWFDRAINTSDPRLMPGARTLHEMEVLRRAGLTTTAILMAATRNAAEALGLADNLGTIAEGKLADLVILNGDLMQDFSALHRPLAVLKEGKLVQGTLGERYARWHRCATGTLASGHEATSRSGLGCTETMVASHARLAWEPQGASRPGRQWTGVSSSARPANQPGATAPIPVVFSLATAIVGLQIRSA